MFHLRHEALDPLGAWLSGLQRQWDAQLQAFKHGKRNNDTGKMMQNVAVRMSDAEMASVAAYIAGIQ